MPEAILIVGATRGLGAALTRQYRDANRDDLVLGTTRDTEPPPPDKGLDKADWLTAIDLMDPNVGVTLADQLASKLSAKGLNKAGARSLKTLVGKSPGPRLPRIH